jgi:hypothetical protein
MSTLPGQVTVPYRTRTRVARYRDLRIGLADASLVVWRSATELDAC